MGLLWPSRTETVISPDAAPSARIGVCTLMDELPLVGLPAPKRTDALRFNPATWAVTAFVSATVEASWTRATPSTLVFAPVPWGKVLPLPVALKVTDLFGTGFPLASRASTESVVV